MRSDSTWMTLRAGLRDLILQEHHRPYAPFNNFLFPDEQSPQLITLIGASMKTHVMKTLRFGARTQRSIGGEIHLRVDIDGIRDESPRLFADCELHNLLSIPKISTGKPAGDIIRRPLTWHRGISQSLDPATLGNLVYSKLIAPFSTVICFFADDFGGLGAIAEILALWLTSFNSRSSDLPPSTYPRVLILTRQSDPSNFNEEKITKSFMLDVGKATEMKYGILAGGYGKLKKGELDNLVRAQFGGIRVVAIPALDSARHQWKELKNSILGESNDLQLRRKETLVAFSGRHFKSFFHLASDHFCSDIVSPFSFVRASRIHNPVPTEFASHLAAFLMSVKPTQLLNFAVKVIGSALVFDSYPAGMHGFHPSLVFKQFFYHTCLQIDPFRDAYHRDDLSSSQLANAIEVAFCESALKIIEAGVDEVSVHRNVLLKFKDIWKTIYSNRRCLSCFARTPEDTLQCHHSLCEPCTMAYGETSDAEPWTFWLRACPLCDEPNEIKFEHKPPTAGVRALIVEGGGIRGIIPLSYLQELETSVNLPMGIQEQFDIIVANSSGAISALGLCSRKWSVSECLKQFMDLSSVAFRKRSCFGLPLTSIGIPGRIVEMILSFICDSRYSSAGITEALITAFGDQSLMFEVSAGGTKVAVVTTTTEGSSTCIFTNYNGPKARSPHCGYNLIRPEEARKELLVWQAARASSAAPPYFKPFEGYHDGGLGGHNNPINLALWEQDIIWSRQKKQPDIVVSLGTGFKRNPDPELGTTEKPALFRARFVPRLFRSFLNFFVGETRWQELQNNLESHTRDRYHRFNFEFYGDDPELDDLQVMSTLRQQVKSQALSSDDISLGADNIIASLFYIELSEEQLPIFNGSLFTCQGRIRCRLGPSNRALQVLATRLKHSKAQFYFGFEQRIACVDDKLCNAIQRGAFYYRDIEFKVISLEDSIDIKIDGIIRRARSISNCPYKIETLIKDQDLDYPFGSRIRRKRTQQQSKQRIKRVRFQT